MLFAAILGFKEILWDSGAIWVVLMAMCIGWILTLAKEWMNAKVD